MKAIVHIKYNDGSSRKKIVNVYPGETRDHYFSFEMTDRPELIKELVVKMAQPESLEALAAPPHAEGGAVKKAKTILMCAHLGLGLAAILKFSLSLFIFVVVLLMVGFLVAWMWFAMEDRP